MNRKIKRFIANLILTLVPISFVIRICDALRSSFGGEALTIMLCGLYIILFVAICLFGWRFYTGFYRDGDFWID